jgi:hypothetical protein
MPRITSDACRDFSGEFIQMETANAGLGLIEKERLKALKEQEIEDQS